jgi:hypothetical protein
MKRLERLEQAISLKRPRIIVYEAHETTSESEHAEFLRGIAPSPDDLVVCLTRFTSDDPGLPRLVSISSA